MNDPTFIEWLLDHQHEGSPVGDLARDVRQDLDDHCMSRSTRTARGIRRHLTATHGIRDRLVRSTIDDAVRQYTACYGEDDDPQTVRRRAEAIRARADGTGMNPSWPYGLAPTRLDEREAAVDWALTHHLMWSRGHHCLHWLLTGHCNRLTCRDDPTHGFGVLADHGITLSGRWLDHVTAWTRGGRPDTLVAQPYDLDDADRTGLEALGRGHGLDVEIDDASGWYRRGTTWIAVRRAGDVSELVDLVHRADRDRRRAVD